MSLFYHSKNIQGVQMKKILTIGQFANILNVSTKTLRYYEKK